MAEREDDEYTLVHATSHCNRVAERMEPTSEPTATPPNKTSSSTLDPVQTTGPCQHPSGVQYPIVHGDPGGTQGATGYQAPYNIGQRSARRRHWGAGYDFSNPV